MISSFVYLCALIYEKPHLELITCQKMHSLIFSFFKMSLTFFKTITKKKNGFETKTIEVVVKKLLLLQNDQTLIFVEDSKVSFFPFQ
jgi:hypothetical protein